MQAATKERRRAETEQAGLDLNATALFVGASFAWRPAPATRVLLRVLSRLMRPLEEGSYDGRTITGAPHRASAAVASPLTVFALARAGYSARVVLAARLGRADPINIVEVSPGLSATARGAGLDDLLAIQRRSRVSLRIVPVARTSHQLSPQAGTSMALRAHRAAPQNLARRAASLARTLRTGRVKNCAPLMLASWLARQDGGPASDQAKALRLELAGRIESQQRACAGPAVMPVREVKRRVLADPVLASYLHGHALDTGESRDEILSQASTLLDEIASDYRVGVVRWFVRAVDFLFDRVLTDLEVDRAGVRFLAECDSRSRLVLVCSHKSYLDPLLIGYALFRSGMVPPQQAAGKNLDFWPVGWLLRHSGAFYLRRTFAGETLYREVFSAYVRYLLAENHVMVVYIEGTRSRDGKLALPKTGFMQILAESLGMGVCAEITLVPVYLGYDRVPEESAHVREMAGGRKISESVKGFGRIYRSVNTRLGRAYVKFAPPLSMKRLLAERGLQGAALAACDGINSVTPLTARSVASCALLASSATRVRRPEVVHAAETLLDRARLCGLPLAVDCDIDGVMGAIDWLGREGHVARDADEADVFIVEGEGRRFLEYNKNICLHHFLGAALEAAAGSGGAESFLRDLFASEFVPDALAGGGGQGAPVADEDRALFASLLESYLESYLASARATSCLGEAGARREDLLENCLAEGAGMLKAGRIARPESVSKTAALNALRHFASAGMLTQVRQSVPGKADAVTLTRGPRFGELSTIEKTLASMLRR